MHAVFTQREPNGVHEWSGNWAETSVPSNGDASSRSPTRRMSAEANARRHPSELFWELGGRGCYVRACPRRQPPRSAQRGAETKTAFGHVLFADQAKSAVDARVAIGQRGLVGRRIVPGESALSIWEANDCTIPESGIANKRRPATAGDKFSTMVFNRGTSGCGVSVLGSRVLYDQFNNNICTHNGLISIACGVRNTD